MPVQVLALLEQMGLKKLQENFITERVTGEILLECDDEVLYQELKVSCMCLHGLMEHL